MQQNLSLTMRNITLGKTKYLSPYLLPVIWVTGWKKMVTKTVVCPSCKNRVTVHGDLGERVHIVCPRCKTKGVVSFPEEMDLKPAESSAIFVKNLTKFYDGCKAVDDVSFSVKKGEIFGFLGPNGAGKTTTIKAILGLIHANSGEIRINGFDVKRDEKEAKKFVGYLPEKVSFYDNLTALQNLYFYAETKGVSREECKVLLEEFGLGDVANKKVGGFSKGMVQRLGMARAVLGSPSILILDEPSGGLDPRGVVLVRNKILELNHGGATVFLSSHILSEVQAVCSRVAIINKGVLVAKDTVSRLGSRLNMKPRIIIELEKVSDEILEMVGKIRGVDGVEVRGKTIEVVCDARTKAEVILTIAKNKGNILNLQTREPSLEEVFMQYTEA